MRKAAGAPTRTDNPPTGVSHPWLSSCVQRAGHQFLQLDSGITTVVKACYAPKPTVKSFKFVWNGCLQTEYAVYYGQALMEGDIGNSRAQLPFTWQEMFACFHNLERLSITLDMEIALMKETVLAPLRTLTKIKNQGGLEKLEHLSFRPHEDLDVVKQVFKILGETKIVLRSLALGCHPRKGYSVPELEYYQLLEKQKENLETLNVEELVTPNEGVFPPGVIFPNITTLLIAPAQFEGIKLFKNAPALETVRILGESKLPQVYEVNDFNCFAKAIQEELESDDELAVCENMKELVCKKVCTLKKLLQLTRLMPNVEVLEMPLENNALQLVCQKWTKLRRLTILEHPLGGVSDAGVVGCGDSPWDYVPSASIKDLKDLCYLKFAISPTSSRYYDDSSDTMTFLSLSQGILQLPRLGYLKVYARLSQWQKEELFRRVSSCVLHSKNVSTGDGDWEIATNIWRE